MKFSNKHWGKKLIVAGLSFTIALSGGAVALPNQADAAKIISTTKAKQATGSKIIKTGRKYLGTPYKWGSKSTTTRTFDCSSFVQRVFKENGYQLARTSRAQYYDAKPVSRKNLKVGDLVFFSIRSTLKYPKSSNKRIGHVGIYAGNNKVLHTFGKGGVTYSDMSKGWWNNHYVRAVRILK